MATYKVHIPGKGMNGVQRCIRCHAVITRPVVHGIITEMTYWREGIPVASDGRKNMTVRIPADARDCGRKAAVK